MKTPHPQADLIIEWTKDITRPVQFENCRLEWEDCSNPPLWTPKTRYRFKPSALCYRVALLKASTPTGFIPSAFDAGCRNLDGDGSDINGFIRWLEPIKEVALP